ncbi:hypothetical protein LCGC14_1658100 [marine sediment metagenome]|uniref:Uncharacterized protein n=1 Tax=marine sediment metagenome TaxID=412755 RepID=A0A0F9HUW5_9ZZZZ
MDSHILATFDDPTRYAKLARASVGDVALFYGFEPKAATWQPVGFGFQKDKGWTPDKAVSFMTSRPEYSEGAFAVTTELPKLFRDADFLVLADGEDVALTDAQIDGWWAVTKIGKWRGWIGCEPADFEVTPENLVEMAQGFDPNVMEIPVNTDHSGFGIALGWVEQLRVSGELLEAKFKQLNPGLRSELRHGGFRSRSAEIFFDFQGSGKAYRRGRLARSALAGHRY